MKNTLTSCLVVLALAAPAFAQDPAPAAPEQQPRLAVLSYPFWERRFGGDAAVIGRDIALNGESFAIVGVLPNIRPVTMFQDPDVYVPISRLVLPTVDDRRNGNALAVLARLRQGVTPDQALGAMTTVNRQIEAASSSPDRRNNCSSRQFCSRYSGWSC